MVGCIFLGLLLSTVLAVYGDEVCDEDGCHGSELNGDSGLKPFSVVSEGKWIAFGRIAEIYSSWHDLALKNEDLPCDSKKIVVFTPNAGLGDSVGALTTGYLYALRAGRLFFIDWKPYPWSIVFQGLPFHYNFRKVLKMTTKSGQPLICPKKNDPTSYLHGHITTNHPLTKEADDWDFHTDYDEITKYFLKPAAKVEKIMKSIVDGPFDDSGLRNDEVLHKVAMVLRTGIGEYNQFLSLGDEKTFVSCFNNYAKNYQMRKGRKRVKFIVFVTSDDAETKKNTIEALESNPNNFDLEVVTLKDSAIHVMQMSKEESKETNVRDKLRKTIAEFFLIGMCEARFLTHGSLFGRVAAERGGGDEKMNFFISDSNCDGKREKYSYLSCHEPKYPNICNL